MSRVGKLPVNIPENVKVTISGNTVIVEGPKGKLSNSFASVVLTIKDNHLHVEPLDDSSFAHAMSGTARSIINGMIKGVLSHYVKNLLISGVGFKAILSGKVLDLNLGYSHVIKYQIPESVMIAVADGTKLKIEGPDKQLVGQVAADIKSYYPVEPYKAKGVSVVGEYVRRKEGKKTA